MVFEKDFAKNNDGIQTSFEVSSDDSIRKTLNSALHASLHENHDGDSKISAFPEYPLQVI